MADQIEQLFQSLIKRDYAIFGPTVRDGAIIYDRIEDTSDLPRGVTDRQEAGKYSLASRPDQALFGYAIGPHSWKKYFHPARVKLFGASTDNGVFRILQEPTPPRQPTALLGVRACELAAIAIQDKVLLDGPYADEIYRDRRKEAFLIAMQCTESADTCFCSSMGTGPAVPVVAADITLTEIADNGNHWFLAEAGTPRGGEVLLELEHQPAGEADCLQVSTAVAAAGLQQKRRLDTTGLREALQDSFDHPHWDEVAKRCLDCANCTMVCPTCFCTDIEDVSDVSGDHAERWRRWDSCFTTSFSYIHGGSVRSSPKARYRQWITHKLSSWVDQFGTSGCVGCGRCITWCPAGIDITEEAQAIRGTVNHGNT